MAPRYGGRRTYARSGNKYFKSRCTTRPQKPMLKLIRSVVAASTQAVVSHPRTDPPNFKLDRPFKRRVRVVPSQTATNVTIGDIATLEGSYYGLTQSRWQNIKILCITAYGELPQAATTNEDINLTLVVPASGSSNIGSSVYQDRGDGNHRPCIKIINPPTTPIYQTNVQTVVCNFNASTVSLIDFYVEFS